MPLTRLYAEAGLTTLEVTLNTAGAPALIRLLVQEFGGTLNIGAGTVCTPEQLDQALNAGAQFIVTPILDEAVIAGCVAAQVPVFPGAYTPTEIYKAWQLGASLVKVFPATKLGPGYIKEILAPLDHLKLLPTGGVSIDNFTQFLQAGATGVGIGSQLFPKNLLENEQWDSLRQLYTDFAGRIRDYQLNRPQ
jgi:2-dehydro-3-deoxyphosphogluconate aldolase/(4S)-4-hydroxy-2-oxoglutarate aldolase